MVVLVGFSSSFAGRTVKSWWCCSGAGSYDTCKLARIRVALSRCGSLGPPCGVDGEDCCVRLQPGHGGPRQRRRARCGYSAPWALRGTCPSTGRPRARGGPRVPGGWISIAGGMSRTPGPPQWQPSDPDSVPEFLIPSCVPGRVQAVELEVDGYVTPPAAVASRRRWRYPKE